MKNIKTFFLATLITSITCFSQKINNIVVDNKLNNLLEKKEYFKLKDELAKNKEELSKDRILYYDIFVSKAFGKRKKSNSEIDTFFKKYSKTLNDTVIVKLLDIKASNFLYLYEYKNASLIFDEILTKYPQILDSADVSNYKNVKNLFKTFANVKPQTIHKKRDIIINANRNNFNHLMTPVKIDTTTEDFIFDTGANLSTISESQAKKMNLQIFEQDVEIGSSTQMEIKSRLAVADSLYLGDILFENVLFIVMPDEQLTFPQIDYKINGIIGIPVIHQLGEVHLRKDGKIFIPKVPSKKVEPNMFLEGLNPVVQVTSDSDKLLFTFDTGAKHTELSFKYFNEHKSVVEKGEFQSRQRGGAGGMVEVKEFSLSNFPLKIGKHETNLDKIPVTLEEYDFNKYFDGNLGQDVFLKFNSLVMNFESMYIDFE